MSPTAVFLDGFPGSPKPKPGTATRPLVFEDYLTDAHTQSVARMARMAVYWSDNMLSSTGTPRKKRIDLAKENSETNNKIKDTNPEASQTQENKQPTQNQNQTQIQNQTDPESASCVYIEGTFMCAVYDKLEGMLDKSMDENLILTEIFAKLAQCPDQCVQNLLTWENSANDNSERRSLVLVLKSVWQEAQERVNEVENFEEAIDAHRVRLGTIMENRTGSSDTSPISSKGATKMQSSFCEGYVVLEEFVKEISANIQARGELEVLYRRLM